MELAEALRKHNSVNSLVEKTVVAESIAEKLRASQAPDGTYNLPMLLEKRRHEYGIPNGAFESFPAFDKVYVWQIPNQERRTYAKEGTILKPDAVIAYDRNTAPRGVLISAGLQALDALRSTGIDIGHIIRFKKFSPFIQPIDEIDGKELTVWVIRDGDIVSSEDLASDYHARRISIINASDDGLSYDHRFGTIKNDEVVSTGKKVSAYYDPST